MDKIQQLQQFVDESSYIVFFGGAGVSTESGIPDFRSTDGLYHMKYHYPPEQIISRSFFEKDPEEFYRFYRDKMLWPEAQPNPAHEKLAQLVGEVFDMRPAAIIDRLNLRRPIYAQTASYGHFGRLDLDLPWEKTDYVDRVRAAAEKLR